METIPLLQRLPSWLYALPTVLRKGRQGMMTYRYLCIIKGGAENRDRDSFSKTLFEDKAGGLLTLETGSLTSKLIGGGIDTTTSKMLSFILASIAFPDTLKKAQEELNKVVGRNRLPDWQDENNVPYCRSMIKDGGALPSSVDYHMHGSKMMSIVASSFPKGRQPWYRHSLRG
jgi:hypothetical protein